VTIPIGYADGVYRNLSEIGSVLIDGKRYPFAGTVTMDMTMVDVGDDDVRVGAQVVLIGKQGGETITPQDWADLLGTISYEIVCDFGPRLTRRYIGGNVNV
jgi:alanine racemase